MEYAKGDVIYYAGRYCKIRNVYPDKELKYSVEARYKTIEDGQDRIHYVQFAINVSNEKSMHRVKRT